MDTQIKFSQEIETFKKAVMDTNDFSDEEILKLFENKILYLKANSAKDIKTLFDLTNLIKSHRPNVYKQLKEKYLLKPKKEE